MPHLILELVLWILLAFFIGCIAGCLLRRAFGKRAVETAAAPQPAQSPEPTRAAKTTRPKPARKTPGTSK